MRLVTVSRGERTAAGILAGGDIALIPGYEDVGTLLADGDAGLRAAREVEGLERVPFEETRLRRPVLEPGATFCVGLNYASHIREMGRDLPSAPTLFSKLSRALTDPYAPIPLVGRSEKIDYEGELCAVIGKAGRDVAADDAWDHVAGLTVMNDTTVRDYQKRTIQWFAGKTWEDSTPVGPCVVTHDEVDYASLEVVTRVNGEERQRGSVSDLVFGVPELVEDISRIVTLRPGDLIATGTPGGVGVATERFLDEGDVVEVEVPGVGLLHNAVEASR